MKGDCAIWSAPEFTDDTQRPPDPTHLVPLRKQQTLLALNLFVKRAFNQLKRDFSPRTSLTLIPNLWFAKHTLVLKMVPFSHIRYSVWESFPHLVLHPNSSHPRRTARPPASRSLPRHITHTSRAEGILHKGLLFLTRLPAGFLMRPWKVFLSAGAPQTVTGSRWFGSRTRCRHFPGKLPHSHFLLCFSTSAFSLLYLSVL